MTEPTPFANGGPVSIGFAPFGTPAPTGSAAYVVPAGAPYPTIPTDGPSTVVRAVYYQADGSTRETTVGPLLESRAHPVVHLPTDPPPPPTCVYLGHRPRMVWIRDTDGETVPVCVRCGAAL